MASASIDEDLVRESLECPICKDYFDEPKQLVCGHTFCRECIERLDKVPQPGTRGGDEYYYSYTVNFAVQCPQCRDLSIIPQSGLSTNYVVKEMVDKFREIGVSNALGAGATLKLSCHTCSRKIPQGEIFMCKDCSHMPNGLTKKLFLCSLCVVTRGHKDHNVVIGSELASKLEREQATKELEHINNKAHEHLEKMKIIKSNISRDFDQFHKHMVKEINNVHQLHSDCLDMESTPLKQELESKVKEAQKLGQLIEHAHSQTKQMRLETAQRLNSIKTTFGLNMGSENNEASDLIDFGTSQNLRPVTSSNGCSIASYMPSIILASPTNLFAYNNNEELENKRRSVHKRKPRRVTNTLNDESTSATVFLD